MILIGLALGAIWDLVVEDQREEVMTGQVTVTHKNGQTTVSVFEFFSHGCLGVVIQRISRHTHPQEIRLKP